MKKNLLILIIFIAFSGCRLNYMIKLPDSSSIPEMYSTMGFDDFESTVIGLLIQAPISLKIDTAYQSFEVNSRPILNGEIETDTTFINRIIAYELYEGKPHKRWFFFETKWVEQTIYFIQYKKEDNGVFYTMVVKSFEAPNENYSKWQSTYPSQPTKESLIIQKINM
ncbi:MAG: hypothetical protein RIG77_20570 [Cyclobacteriaceae bacterium]